MEPHHCGGVCVALGIGLYLPTWPGADRVTPHWPDMRALAHDAEQLGVDNLWVADEPGFWECWTILSALAEATSTVGIGPLVACTRYRWPTLFATMVRALDEVSGGRLVLALGSGQGPSDKRWPAFGFDGTAHVARFGEAVEVIARGLRTGSVSFDGRFYEAHEPKLGPTGPHDSGPPIWIAAGRPRTLDVAVRWGDAVNWTSSLSSPDAVRRFRDAVAEACAKAGRDPASLALTGWTRLAPSKDGKLDRDRADTIAGTPSEIGEQLAGIHEAGIAHLTCFIGDEDDGHAYPALTRRSLDRFAQVFQAVRET